MAPARGATFHFGGKRLKLSELPLRCRARRRRRRTGDDERRERAAAELSVFSVQFVLSGIASCCEGVKRRERSGWGGADHEHAM